MLIIKPAIFFLVHKYIYTLLSLFFCLPRGCPLEQYITIIVRRPKLTKIKKASKDVEWRTWRANYGGSILSLNDSIEDYEPAHQQDTDFKTSKVYGHVKRRAAERNGWL